MDQITAIEQTSPAWTNMLAQMGLAEPVLPQNAPVSASKGNIMLDDSADCSADVFDRLYGGL